MASNNWVCVFLMAALIAAMAAAAGCGDDDDDSSQEQDDTADGDDSTAGDDDLTAADDDSSISGDDDDVAPQDDDVTPVDDDATVDDDDDDSSAVDDDDATVADDDDTQVSEMPTALCGMQPYELLPRDRVGHLTAWEEYPLFDLAPESVDSLLAEVGYDAFSPVPYGCRVFKYSYTTQDRGQPVEATAMLSIPANSKDLPREELPFVIYEHGTTGFTDPCAPSANVPDGPAQAALLGALGFVAVAPDYIGLKGMGDPSETVHGYLVGEQVAIGSWDALRAAQELLDGDLARTVRMGNTVGLWGGSQGGHAAWFTELYAPYYAPEFDVPGVVSAVPPTDLMPLVKFGLEQFSPPTISLAAVIVTMSHWYGAPTSYDGIFTNEEPYYFADNANDILFVKDECNAGEGLEGDEVEQLYAQEFIDAVLNERWDEIEPLYCYFTENAPVSTSIKPQRFTPTYIVHSENDELVITPPLREAFDELCEQGFQLEYLECANALHSEGAIWSLPEQYEWLKARIAGEPIDPAKLCVRSEPVCCSQTPADKCP